MRQIFNLSVPANETINLAHLTTKYPIENFYKIYRDDVKRKTLLEENWLPTQHGALFQTIGVHQNNDLYDTGLRVMVVQFPLLKPKTRKIEVISDDPRFTTDLRANLSFFKERYEDILKERPDDWDNVAGKNSYIRNGRSITNTSISSFRMSMRNSSSLGSWISLSCFMKDIIVM